MTRARTGPRTFALALLVGGVLGGGILGAGVLGCGGHASSSTAPGSGSADAGSAMNDHSAPANDHSAANPDAASDATALVAARALVTGDGGALLPHLDDASKKKITPDQVAAIGKQLAAAMGAVKTVAISSRATVDGTAIRIVGVTFDHGAIDLRVGIDPTTQLVSTILTQAPGSTTAAGSASADPDATALAVAKSLAAGDWDRVTARFAGTMKGVTATQVADGFKSITARLGAVKDISIAGRHQQQDVSGRIMYLACERGAIYLTVVIDGPGRIAGLTMDDVETAAYVDATKFHEEPIVVGDAPTQLPGVVTLPNGKGPFPAVVLVHGSGPGDRDETVGENKPFLDLAQGLASRGIASVRYDKRAHVTHKNDETLDDETILDALAAITLADARPEIDPARVFVVGHSLGAGLAPEIARRSKTAAGAVAMAPPGRRPEISYPEQLRYLGEADHAAAFERSYAATTGKPDEILEGMPRKYWDDWAAHDGVAEAKKFRKPLLVLHGDRDYQVTDADFQIWKRALAGMKNATVVSFPGDNHPFEQGAGKAGPAEYYKPSHVDAAVIDKLASWILKQPRR